MSHFKTAHQILKILKDTYKDAKIMLHFSNHWELLVAVCLSAQCTDKKVNEVTAQLFPKYRAMKHSSPKYTALFPTITPEIHEIINFAEVPRNELEHDIRQTGFFRNKAKNIQAAAAIVLMEYHATIPKTMNEIVKIPGVARKTGNVVLGNAYGVVEGIAVDTHVMRLSQRLGLSKNKTPEKIEHDLMRLYPQNEWFTLTYYLIEHGRAVCNAKKPKCTMCVLNNLCPSAFQFPHFTSSIAKGS